MEDQDLINKNRYDEDVKNGIIPEKTLIEKQVWESTLNRSMVLQAENEQLKELLGECIPFVELCNYTPENRRLLKSINELLGEE